MKVKDIQKQDRVGEKYPIGMLSKLSRRGKRRNQNNKVCIVCKRKVTRMFRPKDVII